VAADDDLSAPLGQTTPKKPRFRLPVRPSHGIAGMLGFALLIFGGWALLADDPFGGEPMVIVSTDSRGPAPVVKGGEPPPAAPAMAAAPAPSPTPASTPTGPAASNEGSTSGGATVNVIDGMTGKRQEVPIGSQDDKVAAPAVDQRLIETSRHGPLPKIAADGTRPADAYARPLRPDLSKVAGPRVAIVIGGLGIGAAGTFEAMAKLPGPITFAFAPYGTDLARWVARARNEGHEVLLQVPMEPFDYPDNDPGPQTLLTSLNPTQNLDRLHWFMSRFQGYVGIANYMGARFTASENTIGPLLRDTAKRGLIFFDDGTSPRSAVPQIAGATNAPFAKADLMLDSVATPAAIDAALARLEAMARDRSVAVGVATALPVSIERVAQWVKGAENRGITLVPISMVAFKPKQS
jgi:polysaccharide deacetylase 2 family uncharacterized protein YibQ